MTDMNMAELKKIIESSSDMTEVSKKAGISRNTIYYYLSRHGYSVVKRMRLVKKR